MTKHILEKHIEQHVCDYAKSKGILCYKFTSPANRSVCDRIFMYNGFVFFIEFKAFGKKPTPSQNKHHQLLAKTGVTVYVVDSVTLGKEIIDDELQGKRSSRNVVRYINRD